MKLYEILDTKMDIEYEIDSKMMYAHSTIDNNTYECYCQETDFENSIEHYFDEKDINNQEQLRVFKQQNPIIWHIAFNQVNDSFIKNYDLTNANVPLKVFSFIKQALLKFVNQYHPKYITFTADSNSRKQLYIKLISKSIQIKKQYNFNNSKTDIVIIEI
jgi:hypothetical protein